MTPRAEHVPATEPPVQGVAVARAPHGLVKKFRGARKLVRKAQALALPGADVVVLAVPEGQGERLASKLVSDNWRNDWCDAL